MVHRTYVLAVCVCALSAVVCRQGFAAGKCRERGGLLFFLVVVYLEVTVGSMSTAAMFGFY